MRRGLDVDSASDHLHVRLETISFAGARLWQLSSCAQNIVRTRRLDRDGFLPVAVLQTHGTSVIMQSDRQCRLDPGTFAFVNAARPILFDHRGEFTQIYLEFPRSTFAAEEFESRTTVAVSTSQPADRLFYDGIRGLWEALPSLDPIRHSAAVSAAKSLSVLTSVFQSPEPKDRVSIRAVRAMDFIERHLGDCDLSAETVAASQGVSRRHLDELFIPLGFSISAWIWERRLQRIAETLRTEPEGGVSLLMLALDHGFKSQSHFSRAFMKRYGTTPRAYKLGHLG
jgi:AraC-like DNA-binding protein